MAATASSLVNWGRVFVVGLREIVGGQICEPRQPPNRLLPSSKRLVAILNPMVQAGADFRRKGLQHRTQNFVERRRPFAGIHFDGGRKIGSQGSSGGLSIRARHRFRNNAAGKSSGKREKAISARKKSRARQACNPSEKARAPSR
jgi:hypothetical protein